MSFFGYENSDIFKIFKKFRCQIPNNTIFRYQIPIDIDTKELFINDIMQKIEFLNQQPKVPNDDDEFFNQFSVSCNFYTNCHILLLPTLLEEWRFLWTAPPLKNIGNPIKLNGSLNSTVIRHRPLLKTSRKVKMIIKSHCNWKMKQHKCCDD